jgi:hypothetical protein
VPRAAPRAMGAIASQDAEECLGVPSVRACRCRVSVWRMSCWSSQGETGLTKGESAKRRCGKVVIQNPWISLGPPGR